MNISVIYLLEDTNMIRSGQKLVKQKFGNLISKSYLGVHIDRTLSFDENVLNVCKKAACKLSV